MMRMEWLQAQCEVDRVRCACEDSTRSSHGPPDACLSAMRSSLSVLWPRRPRPTTWSSPGLGHELASVQVALDAAEEAWLALAMQAEG